MKGHPTPMGVFSVIQKHKMHHSNIYSGAPMPFMQRITWSGVALHAGVLPGYPASHGCIRMPMAFAVKMWNWTKMGARVDRHARRNDAREFLASVAGGQKVVPQPRSPSSRRPTQPLAVKADKGAPELQGRSKPKSRTALDRRSQRRSVAARPDPHRRCQRRCPRTRPTMSDVRSSSAAKPAKPRRCQAGSCRAEAAKAETAKADDAPQSTSTDTVGKDAKSTEAGGTAKSNTSADTKPADVAGQACRRQLPSPRRPRGPSRRTSLQKQSRRRPRSTRLRQPPKPEARQTGYRQDRYSKG